MRNIILRMISMSSFEIHNKKYRMFLKDAKNEKNSQPTRIEAYFEACFHLIEAVAAKKRLHINKHQLVRKILEENEDVFGGKTEDVWRSFQEIENQIRPGQIYGGAINGEALDNTKRLASVTEVICNTILRKRKKTAFRNTG